MPGFLRAGRIAVAADDVMIALVQRASSHITLHMCP
jgi:hypothetical protein